MDGETLKRIEQIEHGLRDIMLRERKLGIEREKLLMSDEEYFSYIEHYAAYYDDDPLSIRAYYEKMQQLEEINRLFNLSDVDIEAAWVKYGDRIRQLERELAA